MEPSGFPARRRTRLRTQRARIRRQVLGTGSGSARAAEGDSRPLVGAAAIRRLAGGRYPRAGRHGLRRPFLPSSWVVSGTVPREALHKPRAADLMVRRHVWSVTRLLTRNFAPGGGRE